MPLLELERVAYETRIRYTTIRKIRDGQTQDPRLNTILPLSAWLERAP